MLFDTDVLIFIQRGNLPAARLLERTRKRFISIVTKMELIQGALNKGHHQIVQSFLKDFHIQVLPLTENLGYRASIYIEEYSLSHHMRLADSLIASTAVENSLPLATANTKHYKAVKELELKIFRP